MSVARAQREINSVEFADWMAFYNIEPFGERIADIRMGMLAATTANIHRDPKTKAFEPADFMPWVKQPKKEILFDDPKDQARFVALALFGIDIGQAKGRKFKVKRRSGGEKN
ncbi:DUF4035 domain-containing protein [Caballeronia sp. LZ032]|uniref:phage tail assembly protein T n=1 Tax=Caballeronia sp. LZ032 TaxID=3038565 RepID=UPI00285780A2|nr:DUF4035 domain-containing protein [Caballeronia sp. LZ032]MDR5881122.1 DUF4035 domain-containing protein [Caballeronia sp. LZ032]